MSHELSPEAVATVLAARDRFLAFLEGRVGSHALAEDVLQEAYRKAVEQGAQLRDDESAVAWFFRLLRNSIIDRARRDAAAARALERFAGEMDTSTPDGEAETAVCACVTGVLGTLKPEYEAAVRALDLDGQSVGEFAAHEGITANNASVRAHRARAALERRLRQTCGACAEHGCIDCTCKPSA